MTKKRNARLLVQDSKRLLLPAGPSDDVDELEVTESFSLPQEQRLHTSMYIIYIYIYIHIHIFMSSYIYIYISIYTHTHTWIKAEGL